VAAVAKDGTRRLDSALAVDLLRCSVELITDRVYLACLSHGRSVIMSDPAFGTTPTFTSDDSLDLAVSPDGQALTITYRGFEALVDPATPPSVVTAVRSVALPVEGFAQGVTVAVRIDGFAFATDGAAASAVLIVNGNAGVERVVPGADGEFVHEVVAEGTGAAECRVCVILVAERDSADPDAVARLNVLSLDAEITRSSPADAS
jgi:hypothetical protein